MKQLCAEFSAIHAKRRREASDTQDVGPALSFFAVGSGSNSGSRGQACAFEKNEECRRVPAFEQVQDDSVAPLCMVAVCLLLAWVRTGVAGVKLVYSRRRRNIIVYLLFRASPG